VDEADAELSGRSQDMRPFGLLQGPTHLRGLLGTGHLGTSLFRFQILYLCFRTNSLPRITARLTADGDRGLRQLQRLKAIHQAAGQSVGLPVDASACYVARLLVESLKGLKDEIAQTMKQIEGLCQSLPGYKLLLSIPVFGPYIAALVLATLADPLRFASRKQVIRLAGLDLNANRSGKKSQDSVPVISKKAMPTCAALYQAALIASYHNDGFRRLYQRMLDGRQGERGIKTKARVKLAAKMLVIAWTMLKNNDPFDETRLLAESVDVR
jgi:transposase